jgi:hypothetical protein
MIKKDIHHTLHIDSCFRFVKGKKNFLKKNYTEPADLYPSSFML